MTEYRFGIDYWVQVYSGHTDERVLAEYKKASDEFDDSSASHSAVDVLSAILETRGYTYDQATKEWKK